MSLDLDNLTPQEEAFRDTLADAGVPTDSASLKAAWQSQVDASPLTITNTSSVSPFWALITALVTTPVLWLVAYCVRHLMPSAYVQTATGAALDLLAWTYGVSRKAAAMATGEVTFTRTDTAAVLEIPAGTVIRTVSIAGTIYRVQTTAAAQFEVGEDEVAVPVIATESGAAHNLGAGYYTIIESGYIPGATVTNGADWLATPGADTESDTALRARIRNQFLATGQWHTDAAYRSLISEFAGIDVDRIYFDHDIPRGPGSADAYILYDAAATPAAQLAAINDYISSQGNHGHGDDLLVLALPETFVSVAATVYFQPETPPADVAAHLATIEGMFRCIFRENSDYLEYVTQVRPEARISVSRAAAEIHSYIPDIDSIEIVYGGISVADIDIEVGLEVPRLDTITITDGDAE